MKFSVRGSSALTVGVAAAALFVSGAGGAVAGSLITSAQIKDGTIQGVDVKTGTLNGSDVKDGSLRGADVADYSLTNQDVNVLYASVNADGTLNASSGGVTSGSYDGGAYWVRFAGRNLTKCAFNVQVADLADGSDNGQTGAADLEGHADGVYVQTLNSAGSATDKAFHLIVVC